MKALRISRLAIALATFAALGACSDSKDDVTNVVPKEAVTIAVVPATNNQAAPVNNPLPVALAVTVLDADGAPAVGATVTWAVTGGNGYLASGTSGIADTTGTAYMAWNMGPTAGTNTATASISNGQSVTFTATGQ